MADIKKFDFNSKLKQLPFLLMGLGVLGIVLAILLPLLGGNWNHGARLWSNLLLNNYYFTGIAIVGLFFLASHQLGYSGWHTLFKSVPLAMSKFTYVGLAISVLIIIGLWFDDLHHLYSHWTHHPDAFVEGKRPFLTKGFYTVVVLFFFGIWAFYANRMNARFPKIRNYNEYQKSKYLSATFILFFAVGTSVLSWLVVMSLDPHWYSTLFGWYNFASYACAGFATMILILIFLKKMGYTQHITEDHFHDLGKYMFGFSVFWTYLWFSQFMLIWYANIPEATAYFTKRFDVPLFKFIIFLALLINFFLPLLALMTRKSKRQLGTMGFIAVMVIFGHYLDFYQMVMFEPNAIVAHHDAHGDEEHGDDHHSMNLNETSVLLLAQADGDAHGTVEHGDEHHGAHADDHHDGHAAEGGHGHDAHGSAPKTHAKLGLVELLIFFGFIGLFMWIVMNALHGKTIETDEDPFAKESAHHHVL